MTLRQKLFELQKKSRVNKDQTAKISGKGGSRTYKFTSLASAIDDTLLHDLGLMLQWDISANFNCGGEYYIIEARVVDVDSGDYVRCAKPMRVKDAFQDEGAALSYWCRVLALRAMGVIPPSEEDVETEEYKPAPVRPNISTTDLAF